MMTVNELVDKFNILISFGREEILKFCFSIYDLNEDGLICLKDIYDCMSLFTD